MTASPASAVKSKTVATWTAIVGGTLGLHRFYLHGVRDPWGWCFVPFTLVGLVGVLRMKALGGDDHVAWVLIPCLGVAVAAAMFSALVYGLMPDGRWDARFNAGKPGPRTGWPTVIGVIVALVLGAGVLMATLAFSAQRYFEYQAEPVAAPTIS